MIKRAQCLSLRQCHETQYLQSFFQCSVCGMWVWATSSYIELHRVGVIHSSVPKLVQSKFIECGIFFGFGRSPEGRSWWVAGLISGFGLFHCFIASQFILSLSSLIHLGILSYSTLSQVFLHCLVAFLPSCVFGTTVFVFFCSDLSDQFFSISDFFVFIFYTFPFFQFANPLPNVCLIFFFFSPPSALVSKKLHQIVFGITCAQGHFLSAFPHCAFLSL